MLDNVLQIRLAFYRSCRQPWTNQRLGGQREVVFRHQGERPKKKVRWTDARCLCAAIG